MKMSERIYSLFGYAKGGFYRVTGIFLVFIFLLSCSKDEDVDTGVPAEIRSVNNFIWDNMDLYYLWREFIPSNVNPDAEPDPEVFFDKLIYKVEDRWSYITDDYEALVNSFSGINYTFGHNFQLFKEEDSENVFGIIEYVVKDSPAALAGLKRGDVFDRVDGIRLTSDNYRDLLFGKESYTLGMADLVDKTPVPNDIEVGLSAATFQENPIYLDTVLQVKGKKIGYIMYTQFIKDFNQDLNDVFAGFKSEAISELVIDLRYNPGGSVTTAALFASLVAPAFQVENESVFLRYIWNDLVEQYWLDNQGADSPNLAIKFVKSANNLDLDRVYFLVSNNSASASEALINGLIPYMDVVLIGESTSGKYTGSITLHDEKESFNWAIQPIVLKTANVEGNTEFKDGFAPDYLEKDEYFAPLGSLEENMLAMAVSLITGIPSDQLARKTDIGLGPESKQSIVRGGRFVYEDQSFLIIDDVALPREEVGGYPEKSDR
jgi:C-terminal processing protease CtpA/Prc